MIDPKPGKEIPRRIAATIYGDPDRPLLTFIYPGFDCNSAGTGFGQSTRLPRELPRRRFQCRAASAPSLDRAARAGNVVDLVRRQKRGGGDSLGRRKKKWTQVTPTISLLSLRANHGRRSLIGLETPHVDLHLEPN